MILIVFTLTKFFLFQTFGRLAAIPEPNMGLVQLDTVAGTFITVTVEAPLTDTRKPIALRTVASPQTFFGVRLSRLHKRTPKDVCREAVRTVALTKHSLTLHSQNALPFAAPSSCGQVFYLPKTSTKGCFEYNQSCNNFFHKIYLDLIGFI